MNTEKFEEFISQYPIFEYRLLDTKDIGVEERVRTICRQECERYDSTWACPPAVGTLQECEKKQCPSGGSGQAFVSFPRHHWTLAAPGAEAT